MRLENRTAIVTGASSGLGKVMATAFVSEGANVACAALPEPRLTDAVADIAGENGEALEEPADLRSWKQVREMVENITETFGSVDVLVNCAGVTQGHVASDHRRRPVAEVAVDAWDAVLETNLRGVFLCTRAALPSMLSQGNGRVIHVSSGHGSEGRAKRAPYVASKFGLEGFHESLALELRDTGVDSIALRPPRGGVYTEISGEHGRAEDEYAHSSPEVIAEPAVQLASGEGENGGRYAARDDGRGFERYER